MDAMDPLVFLVSDDALAGASDDDIAHTVAVLNEEYARRALARGDLDALAAEVFSTWGFDHQGLATMPRIIDGLLFCPGYKKDKSASSHDCQYVSVSGVWVFESPDLAYDESRVTPPPRSVRQSVCVVPAFEGLEISVVSSTARSGPCKMKSASAFKVSSGVLVPTSRKVVIPQARDY